MPKPKITQTLLDTIVSKSQNLLKFCYFLTVFIVLSCGNNTKTKAVVDTNENTTTETEASATTTNKTILFFGDSITAGYGLDDTNDAFPAEAELIGSSIRT